MKFYLCVLTGLLLLACSLSGCQSTQSGAATLPPPTPTTIPTQTPPPTLLPTSTSPPTQTPIPTLTPTAYIPETQTRPLDSMVMLYIPGGVFQMGSTPEEIDAAIQLCAQFYSPCNRWYYEREGPLHTVTLDPYWIDQTEVSNDQYSLCVQAGQCAAPVECDKGTSTYGDPAFSDHPVVCVDWENANAYCQWAGGRLPTEAEWEYAARGPMELLFPWGNEFDGSRLNYCDENCSQSHADPRFNDGYANTAPVGSYPSGASWAGVLNLGGNVSEWVHDWFDDYSADEVFNPTGPENGSQRMVKGCSWYFSPAYCRGAARPSIPPNIRFDYLGFRCAADAFND